MGRTKQSVIDYRRMLVSRLRVRGMSQREIQARLAMPGEDGRLVTMGPNGKPWGKSTIANDCKALDKDWRERAARNIDEFKAEINAELEEVKREGWRAGDYKVVMAAIHQQRALLGLDEPATVKGVGEKGEVLIRVVKGIDP